MEKVKVEADNGEILGVDPQERCDEIIEQLANDGWLSFNERVVWDYVDSSNKFFRLLPVDETCVSRSVFNQMVYDLIEQKM